MKKQKSNNAVLIELHNWTLGKNPNEYIGKVVPQKSLNVEDLINLVVSRGSNYHPSTYEACFEAIKKMAIEQISNGASIDFGLGHINLKAKGVFAGEQAKWEYDKHSLSIQFKPSKKLKNAVNNCRVKVRGKVAPSIGINTITDLLSGSVNKYLSRGGGVILDGKNIKIVGDEEDVGISLVNLENSKEYLISFKFIGTNYPTNLFFAIPVGLPQGQYQLTIKTYFTSQGRLSKKLIEYTYPEPLELI